jgi:hypothetical protein
VGWRGGAWWCWTWYMLIVFLNACAVCMHTRRGRRQGCEVQNNPLEKGHGDIGASNTKSYHDKLQALSARGFGAGLRLD